MIGERAFHRLSRAYLADCPSRSFTLRNLGSRLVEWLRRNPRMGEVAMRWRLIWRDSNGLISKRSTMRLKRRLAPEDLLELDADFRRAFSPTFVYLLLQYPSTTCGFK